MSVRYRSRGYFAVLLLASSLGCSPSVTAETDSLPTFGWLEQITIQPADILLHAKLDTGADNCSIHAENIERFERDGSKWARFRISNRYGRKTVLERAIVRTAKVKTKKGGAQRRPVVRMSMCIGGLFETLECNLVDRSHFEYPVLIGRNFLAGSALVNSSDTYTVAPNCELPKRPKKKKNSK